MLGVAGAATALVRPEIAVFKDASFLVSPLPRTVGVYVGTASPPHRRVVQVKSSAGTGGSVIDRPTTTPDITKRRDSKRRKYPNYRVLLHNDNVNKREYVVQCLLRLVPGYTVEDALNVMHEAHFNGLALVTVTSQQQAEDIVTGMRSSGLISTMEPDGSM